MTKENIKALSFVMEKNMAFYALIYAQYKFWDQYTELASL